MIRVAFVIGGYPAEEHKRRADVALSYSTPEIQVGIVDVAASPYFYGMTPAEIQLVAPAFIESFKRAKKEGYDAVVPLRTLDLGGTGVKWSRFCTATTCKYCALRRTDFPTRLSLRKAPRAPRI